MKRSVLVLFFLCVLGMSGPAFSRDYIRIVGSATVYPFTSLVAEKFAKSHNLPSPIVEANGTGGGFSQFCKGVGFDYPDISDASRAITDNERALCNQNGVTDLIEVKFGYDGIALIYPKSLPANINLTEKELFLAISKMVPSKEDPTHWVPNYYKKWSEINPNLPNIDISIMGPPSTSGTRDIFLELLSKQCAAFLKHEPNQKEAAKYCKQIRYDGVWQDGSENYNLVLQKVTNNKTLFAVMGYNYYASNASKIHAAKIEGTTIGVKSIADHKYALSRPLYVYVKVAHLNTIPSIKLFIESLLSEKAIGKNGYLTKRGLVPLSPEVYKKVKADTLSKLK